MPLENEPRSGRYPLPLKDNGYVEFAADNAGARALLRDVIHEVSPSENMPLSLHYDEEGQLLRLISTLQRRLPPDETRRIRFRISDGPDMKPDWKPLPELFGEVGGRSVAETILHRLFTTYMQPIVQSGGRIEGYEFLLRPLPELAPFQPANLFETARRIGHHAFLDRAARRSAIRLGASHLPAGTKRFINFLPSSLHQPDECLQGTFDCIRESGTYAQDYVFEVMETERLDDPALGRVFDIARSQGVRLALDDVGMGFATLSTVDRLKPDYVKMDRRWVSGCDTDEAKKRYIGDLVNRAAKFGGTVLAEGVEREEEWSYLRQVGIPLFQGFLFGRASPGPARMLASSR
ncbi:EAL domain-containing protein [Cohnella panacarvi]|uniref:EAL domain-containing protein n=1 Tax=Cohnella panacarvi TaxID=400776 RepID=UPI00047CE0BE|nr:EAL domain-containing protein [Cohnella panacarvi]